jgi:hypothetical protein
LRQVADSWKVDFASTEWTERTYPLLDELEFIFEQFENVAIVLAIVSTSLLPVILDY